MNHIYQGCFPPSMWSSPLLGHLLWVVWALPLRVFTITMLALVEESARGVCTSIELSTDGSTFPWFLPSVSVSPTCSTHPSASARTCNSRASTTTAAEVVGCNVEQLMGVAE